MTTEEDTILTHNRGRVPDPEPELRRRLYWTIIVVAVAVGIIAIILRCL